MIRESNSSRGKEFSSLKHQDWLWDTRNLLFSGYQGPFPRVLSSWGVRLIPYLQLVLMLGVGGATPPLFLHASVECTVATLHFYATFTITAWYMAAFDDVSLPKFCTYMLVVSPF